MTRTTTAESSKNMSVGSKREQQIGVGVDRSGTTWPAGGASEPIPAAARRGAAQGPRLRRPLRPEPMVRAPMSFNLHACTFLLLRAHRERGNHPPAQR